MDEVTKALSLFLVRQGCPPRVCYTCENRERKKRKRRIGMGFFVCKIHPEAGGVGDQDTCDNWTLWRYLA